MITRYDILKYLLTRKTTTNNWFRKKYGRYSKYCQLNGDILKKHQIGGGKPEFVLKYDNNLYNFYRDEIDKQFVVLYAFDGEDSCIVIEINKNEKIANIQNISGLNTCLHGSKNKIGSTLLKITLKLLTKIKSKLFNKYPIEIITLSDDSYKVCPANNKKLDMKKMNVLLSGDTWYGKYGFRPIKDNMLNEISIDTINNKIYDSNKKIMDKIKISDIKLLKYFNKIKNISDIQLYSVDKIIKKHPEMLLKDFLSRLLMDFDSTCILFSEIYEKLYNDIGLKHSGTFYGLFLNESKKVNYS
jgi:hypothetical protein